MTNLMITSLILIYILVIAPLLSFGLSKLNIWDNVSIINENKKSWFITYIVNVFVGLFITILFSIIIITITVIILGLKDWYYFIINNINNLGH